MGEKEQLAKSFSESPSFQKLSPAKKAEILKAVEKMDDATANTLMSKASQTSILEQFSDVSSGTSGMLKGALKDQVSSGVVAGLPSFKDAKTAISTARSVMKNPAVGLANLIGGKVAEYYGLNDQGFGGWVSGKIGQVAGFLAGGGVTSVAGNLAGKGLYSAITDKMNTRFNESPRDYYESVTSELRGRAGYQDMRQAGEIGRKGVTGWTLNPQDLNQYEAGMFNAGLDRTGVNDPLWGGPSKFGQQGPLGLAATVAAEQRQTQLMVDDLKTFGFNTAGMTPRNIKATYEDLQARAIRAKEAERADTSRSGYGTDYTGGLGGGYEGGGHNVGGDQGSRTGTGGGYNDGFGGVSGL